jgi:hypothetical protein
MISPNLQAASFSYWLMNTSTFKLTGPQRVIVQSVYDAAVIGGTVSDQTYKNFSNFTAWRYKTFVDWQALQSSPQVLTDNVLVVDWLQRIAAASLPAPSLSFIQAITTAANLSGIAAESSYYDFIVLTCSSDVNHCTVPFLMSQAFTPSISGSLSFVSEISSQSDGSSYIDLNFNPQADCIACTYDDCVLSSFQNMSANNGGQSIAAINLAASRFHGLLPWYSDNNSYIYINSTNDAHNYIQSNPRAANGIIVNASSSFMAQNNCRIGGSIAGSSGFPNINYFGLCGNYDSVPTNFFTQPVQGFALCNNSAELNKLNLFFALLQN